MRATRRVSPSSRFPRERAGFLPAAGRIADKTALAIFVNEQRAKYWRCRPPKIEEMNRRQGTESIRHLQGKKSRGPRRVTWSRWRLVASPARLFDHLTSGNSAPMKAQRFEDLKQFQDKKGQRRPGKDFSRAYKQGSTGSKSPQSLAGIIHKPRSRRRKAGDTLL